MNATRVMRQPRYGLFCVVEVAAGRNRRNGQSQLGTRGLVGLAVMHGTACIRYSACQHAVAPTNH